MARKAALQFIFITLVLDIVGIGIVIPVLPQLVEEVSGLAKDQTSYVYGILATLYSVMQFLFAPILGSLSDRFGRRPVILIALFGAGLDYFLLAWAPTLGWLFLGRILAGITAANISAATAYIADVSPPEKRAANFGMVGAAFGIGFVLGPLLGGWLGDYGLRIPFIVAGAVTLVNCLYGVFVLPESIKDENRRKFSWKRANPVGALLHLRKYANVLGLTCAYFLYMVSHTVFPACWVLYTGFKFGWGPREVGFSLAYVGVMAVVIQGGVTRRVIPKFGEKRTAITCLLVNTVAYVLYGIAPDAWVIYVIITIGAIGGMSTPALQGMISKSVRDDEQGSLQGCLSSLNSVSSIIGIPLATGLFGFFISKDAPIELPSAPFFSAALLAIAAAIIAAKSFAKLAPSSAEEKTRAGGT